MSAALALDVAGQRYLLPIDRIGPVFRIGAMTRAPLTPPDIAGLVNERGRTLAIVHLARTFDAAAAPPRPGALAVTVEAESGAYAVIVDAVEDIVDIDPREAIERPASADQRRAAPVSALFRRGDTVLALLDVEKLFAPEIATGAAA